MDTGENAPATVTGRVPVALEPKGQRTFLTDAIEEGGGVVVPLAEARALVWTNPHEPGDLEELLRRNPGIEWVQLPWAGIEPMVGVLDADHIWTCGKGVYAEEVAEHALMLGLAGYRHAKLFATAGTWSRPSGESLLGRRVTILGAGGIAASLIRMLRPLRCHITVVRRSDEAFAEADATVTLARLRDVAPTTDLLVVALALTPETTGVVDAALMELLPEHCWIVNVARGAHVVTGDLVAALNSGSIAGAALDVTDPEPLPDGHPLWAMSNCIVTPHTANTPEMAVPVLSRRVSENVRRFAAGEELLGLVDVGAGY